MTKRFYLLLLISLSTFFSACGPNQFSSEPNANVSNINSNTDPEYLAHLNKAIIRIPYVTQVTEGLLSKTKWILLGNYSVLKTTDGSGSEVKLVPNSEFTITFSELKNQECPSGMVCAAVIRNYSKIEVNTTCGYLKFNAYQNSYFDSANILASNLQMVLENKSVKTCSTNVDKNLFEKIENLSALNDLILEIDKNFLFIQNSDGYLVFKKAD